jgi:hypothetical protein
MQHGEAPRTRDACARSTTAANGGRKNSVALQLPAEDTSFPGDSGYPIAASSSMQAWQTSAGHGCLSRGTFETASSEWTITLETGARPSPAGPLFGNLGRTCHAEHVQDHEHRTDSGECYRRSTEEMGWRMGFEPTTAGITIRDSTVELPPPLKHRSRRSRRAQSNSGAPDRTRTCYPRLRRPVLYPNELRAPVGLAGWSRSISIAPRTRSGKSPHVAPPQHDIRAWSGCAGLTFPESLSQQHLAAARRPKRLKARIR